MSRSRVSVAGRRDNVDIKVAPIDFHEQLFICRIIQKIIAPYQIEFPHYEQKIVNGLQFAQAFVEVASS